MIAIYISQTADSSNIGTQSFRSYSNIVQILYQKEYKKNIRDDKEEILEEEMKKLQTRSGNMKKGK